MVLQEPGEVTRVAPATSFYCHSILSHSRRFVLQSLIFNGDYGEPLGLCKETRAPSFSGGTYVAGSGVFEREWSKATVRTDCNAWESTITQKTAVGV